MASSADETTTDNGVLEHVLTFITLRTSAKKALLEEGFYTLNGFAMLEDNLVEILHTNRKVNLSESKQLCLLREFVCIIIGCNKTKLSVQNVSEYEIKKLFLAK